MLHLRQKGNWSIISGGISSKYQAQSFTFWGELWFYCVIPQVAISCSRGADRATTHTLTTKPSMQRAETLFRLIAGGRWIVYDETVGDHGSESIRRSSFEMSSMCSCCRAVSYITLFFRYELQKFTSLQISEIKPFWENSLTILPFGLTSDDVIRIHHFVLKTIFVFQISLQLHPVSRQISSWIATLPTWLLTCIEPLLHIES